MSRLIQIALIAAVAIHTQDSVVSQAGSPVPISSITPPSVDPR
jgi:hypothetical protein